VHIAASVDPTGAQSELVGICFSEGPLDGLGYPIGLSNGQEGTRTILGLVDQLGMTQEHLVKQLGTLDAGEPLKGRGGGWATLAHVVGQLQSGGRRAGNDGRPSQVR
jgi:hypothetical protein